MTTVTIIRTLRDGRQTVEYVPAWLADAIVAAVPQCEPNTASLRVVRGIHHIAPAKQNWQDVAWALAGLLPRTEAVH